MFDEEQSDLIQNEDYIVESFLGDNLRSKELKEMCILLQDRLDGLQRELDALFPSSTLVNEIKSLKRQIKIVKQEENISRFVEASVRVALRTSQIEEED